MVTKEAKTESGGRDFRASGMLLLEKEAEQLMMARMVKAVEEMDTTAA